MSETINILFNPLANAIMTFLLGACLLYWLFTIIMGDGLESDSAAGIEVSDIDVDTDLDSSLSFFSKAGDFINIGKAPFMIIFTLFVFFGWSFTITSSLIIGLVPYGWKSIIVLGPVFILTYLLMHFVTIPVVKLFNNLGYSGEEAHDFLGKMAKMKSSIQADNIGSAEIIINQDVIRLHVKSHDGSKIDYGEEILIINQEPTRKFYFVQKMNNTL